MNKELLNAIAYLSKEKGVSADVICDSLEAVLITAYKKEPGSNPMAEVELNTSDRGLPHYGCKNGIGRGGEFTCTDFIG